MIKSTELRIGNTVRVTFKKDEIGYGNDYNSMVEAIQGAKILVKGDYHWHTIDAINPIPLTAEVLRQAGFHQRMANKETWWFDDIVIQLDSCFWWRIDTDIADEDLGCKARKIEYLHQLQNLYFSLTGTELDPNL